MIPLLLAAAALAGPLPLHEADWQVEVVRDVARITLVQVYRNESDRTVDGWYRTSFDGPTRVDGLAAHVGDRELTGALPTAGEAVGVEIPRIAPGREVVVRLSLITPVSRVGDVRQLIVPLAEGPTLEELDAEGDIAPSAAHTGVQIDIEAGAPLDWLDSPTHRVAPVLDRSGASVIVPDADLDASLVVRWCHGHCHDGGSR